MKKKTMRYDLNSMQIFDFSNIKIEHQIFTKEKKKRINKNKKNSGFIYCVRLMNRLKFGRTTNFISRFHQYKHFIPDAEVIAKKYVDDYVKKEAKLCKIFGCQPNRNEWLDYSEELESKIIEYFNKN